MRLFLFTRLFFPLKQVTESILVFTMDELTVASLSFDSTLCFGHCPSLFTSFLFIFIILRLSPTLETEIVSASTEHIHRISLSLHRNILATVETHGNG